MCQKSGGVVVICQRAVNGVYNNCGRAVECGRKVVERKCKPLMGVRSGSVVERDYKGSVGSGGTVEKW